MDHSHLVMMLVTHLQPASDICKQIQYLAMVLVPPPQDHYGPLAPRNGASDTSPLLLLLQLLLLQLVLLQLQLLLLILLLLLPLLLLLLLFHLRLLPRTLRDRVCCICRFSFA